MSNFNSNSWYPTRYLNLRPPEDERVGPRLLLLFRCVFTGLCIFNINVGT